MRKRDRLLLPRGTRWLVLAPLAILVVNGILMGLFGWEAAAGDFQAASRSPRLEAMARTRMLASLLPFLLAAVFVILLFGRDYLYLFGRGARRQLLPPLLFFIAAAGFSGWQAITGEPGAEGMVGTDVFDVAFSQLAAGGTPLRTVVDVVVLIFVILLSLGAGAVTFGAVSCLATPRPTLPPPHRRALRQLQRARLDRYLYGSAFLLVTGLFFMDSTLRWPASFSTDQALYMEHVNALMLASGILYSTMIAAYYLPVALWLRSVPTAPPTAGSGDAAEPDEGKDMSPSHVLKSMIALLSPAIAGVLTQLIEGAGL